MLPPPLLLLVLPLLVNAGKLTPDENRDLQETCGETDSPLVRSNGIRTSSKDAPFAVALGFSPDSIFCSASFISDRHVMTAAHCVNQFESTNRRPLYVMTTNNINGSVAPPLFVVLRKYRVHKIHFPWYYFNVYTLGDIALLEVEPRNVSNSHLPCLPKADLTVGSGVTLYGYGRNLHDDTIYDNLGVMRSLKGTTQWCPTFGVFEVCFKGFPYLACYGDSGSPLVATVQEKITLSAVVTKINHNCAQNSWNDFIGYLNVGTNTFYNLDWICHASGVCPSEEVERNVQNLEFFVKTKYKTITF